MIYFFNPIIYMHNSLCVHTCVYIYIYHADTYAWSILDSFQKGHPLAGKPMLKQLQLPNTG